MSEKKPLISLVVPCFNEEESAPLFLEAASAVAEEMSCAEFEIIFVDDGSSDLTLSVLKKLAKEDERVKYISFSRNFGKEAAMLAGLESSAGDFVAVMDADLQDPPVLLPEMYRAITEEGYDCVATRRVSRKGEPPIRSFFARRFYKLINKISKTEIVDGARDFRLMTRQVVNAILEVKEYNRFSKGIFGWVGFKTKWLEFDNIPRAAGETKWNFWRLLLYSMDGIIAFSTMPLAISSVAGIIFFLLSIIGVIFIFVRRLWFGDDVAGWASTACIILFAAGIQLFCVGVLGQYMAKTYLEVKRRPDYIIKEKSEKDEKKDV